MDLLFIDVETAGLDADKFSILSFGAVRWRDHTLFESMEIFINESPIFSEPKAMEINKIDLDWVAKNGFTPQEAVHQITNFVAPINEDLSAKVRLAGHNVSFDICFLRRLFRLADADFRALFDHRSIDTFSLYSFLSLSGVTGLTDS